MMGIELDHLMWGAPSLAAGMLEAERLFGITPAEGGVHPGLGTCNALLSLGRSKYLEIIAPDPAQDLTGNLGGRLAALEAPGLITWAAAAPDLAGLAARAKTAELGVRGPIPTSRAAPDGGTLNWELLFLGGHPFGTLVPFFIDWQDTPHPATTNPVAGAFQRLEIATPDAEDLNALFAALGVTERAVPAESPRLCAVIETPRGSVELLFAPGASRWAI